MPPKDSRYPQDWFRLAAKDLKRAEHLLNFDDPEGSGYHLQQTDKYLKGFLLWKGWKLKRIHDLEVLLNDALKIRKHIGAIQEPVPENQLSMKRKSS